MIGALVGTVPEPDVGRLGAALGTVLLSITAGPGVTPRVGAYLGVGLGFAVVLVLSRSLARRTGVPYPVFLVLAGAAGSFLPDMGGLRLRPDVVFLGFLPPLVYHAGLVTSPRELRANALPIGLGALGLVLATTFAVAGAAWAAVPSLGFTAAFVLGAVVAPTDPVAATSVFGRLGIGPPITTVVEGESLVNDGIALTLLSVGLAAVSHPIGIGTGLLDFLEVAGGGTAFGLAVGWVASHLRVPMRDSPSQIVVSLLVPYAAYLPADALGLSGVLAALAAGLVIGQRTVSGLAPTARIQSAEFWQALVFLLESVLFVLVGLQLRQLVAATHGANPAEMALLTGATFVVVVAVRLGWWLAIPTLRWRPEGGRLVDTGDVTWGQRLALGWSGLRGAISLAAALSIPPMVAGTRFPDRNLVVFTTFCVVVGTLVGQGTSLPWLLTRLGVAGDDLRRRQRAVAERRIAEAALATLDELVADDQVTEDDADLLRLRYQRRVDRARAMLSDDEDHHRAETRPPLRQVERRLLATQLRVLHELHRTGDVSFGVMREIRRELDFEQARYR